MKPFEQHLQDLTRRAFLSRVATGLGSIALGAVDVSVTVASE